MDNWVSWSCQILEGTVETVASQIEACASIRKSEVDRLEENAREIIRLVGLAKAKVR